MRYPRACLCCGKTYSYCSSCWDYRALPLWMNSFCSDNCKDIFETCADYNFELITKEEAKELLSACDLSNSKNFNKCVKRDLGVIMQEPKKVEFPVKKAE